MEYKYSGNIWASRPTFADGNCFFHALFGEIQTVEGGQYYLDKHALSRRHLWVAFLTFFLHEEMPTRLAELIQKCFIAIDSTCYNNLSDPTQLLEYARSVSIAEHWVLVEEIPLISALWNVRVVLFLNSPEPEIIKPDPLLLGKYPFKCDAALSEVVIRFADNHFEKLDASPPVLSVIDNFKSKAKDKVDSESDEDIQSYHDQHKETYPKMSGGAGKHGSDYQVKISSMVLLNAMRKLKGWKLSTENMDAHPFDDLVLEHAGGDILIQIKHKLEKKVIVYKAVFDSDSGDFSLLKYFNQFFQKIGRFNRKDNNAKIIICTNADLQTDKNMDGMLELHKVAENSVLHFEGALNKYYTFSDAAVKVLKERSNASEDDIKDFLSRLRFFHRFIDGDNIINSFKKLIPSISLANHLDSEDTFKCIYDMTHDWFDEKSGRGGRHLFRLDAMAMFCEIRSRRYCEAFKQYDAISFKTGFQLVAKQIVHVIPSEEPILNIVKLYQAIREEKSLFLNPDDNLDIQKQVLDVFSFGTYKILVIVLKVNVAAELIQGICKMAERILGKEYKKCIFFSSAENKFMQQIKDLNGDRCEELEEKIRFKDFTKPSQSTLSESRGIIFQGIAVTLNELLGTNIDDYVDPHTLAKLIKIEQIEIGTKLVHADNNTDSCYISRKLQRQDQTVREDQFQDLKYLPSERIVVICDTAGMGKTTILTNLAMRIKEAHPFLFVVVVNLSNCSEALEKALKDTSKVATVDDLVNCREKTRLKSRFAMNLFNKKANVVLMLDGVDEIVFNHVELVTKMIAEAKSRENFRRVFVTTRPHLRQELEKKLKVEAFSLQSLTEDDQKDFLTKYWTHELRLESDEQKRKCQKYAEALIEEISRWINDDTENSFAGIPLQTRMLAEVFQENSKLDSDQPRQWEECKEFLQSDNEEPRLPERINLIRLYELFVEKKREVFVNKFGGNSLSKQMLEEKFEECHKVHYTLALAIVFSEKDCLLFGRYNESKEFEKALVRDYVFRVGIVYEGDGWHNFIHRTFAEYFAAKCIMLELKEGPIKDGFCAFLIRKVLTRAEYHVVRLFFDSFVQNELESIPDNTLATFRNINYTSVLGNTGTTLLHQIAASGLVGTTRFFFACINFAVTGNRRRLLNVFQVDATNLKYQTPLHEACIRGDLNMAIVLIEAGANVDFPDANGETALHLVAFHRHFHLTQYLVNDARADVNKVNSYKESVFYSAVKGGNLDVVKFLVNHPCTNYEGSYNSALYFAAWASHENIVEYLVTELGVGVYIMDVNGRTPLHAAAFKRSTRMVALLVRHGRDVINAVDRYGNTPCHVAALRDFSEIVECLLEHGADGSIVNKDGCNVNDIIRLWRSQSVGDTGEVT